MMSQTACARPVVSVVIPTFNRAAVLARAVSSVLAQSLQDFEVLIVDDGSTDGTRAVINEFTDARLKVIILPVRRGAAAARNTGIERSRGKYIAFLDSDDEYLPSFLEVLVSHMEVASPEEAAVLPSFYLASADGTTTVRHLASPRYRELLRFRQATRPFIVGRTEILSRICFDPALVSYQEWDLFMQLLSHYNITAVDAPQVIVHDEADDVKVSSPRNHIGALQYLSKKYAAALSKDAFAQRQWHMKLVRLHMGLGEVRKARFRARRAALSYPRHGASWGLFLAASANDRVFSWVWDAYRSQSARKRSSGGNGGGEP